jgi:hypothetical protein
MPATYVDFVKQLNTVFHAHSVAGAIELTLVEATEKERRGLPTKFMVPISLVFTGPRHALLGQAVYFVDHPVLGRNQWLFAPINKYATPEFAQTDSQDAATLPMYEVLFG